MTQFTIPNNPNQSFFCSADGFSFRFDFMLFNGVTYCSISEGSEDNYLVKGIKVCTNSGILPPTFTKEYGQFVFINDVDGDYPTYENFNGNNVLTYFSPSELDKITSGAMQSISYSKSYGRVIPENT